MNRLIPPLVRLSVCVVASVGTGLASSAGYAQHEPRAARLQALLQTLPHQKVQVSACVMSLPEGQVIYEREANLCLTPASNQKIIAAATALEALGTAYRFETRLVQRGDDLMLIGGGDPALGDPRIAEQQGRKPLDSFIDCAQRLKSAGIEIIHGDIVIDDTAFEHVWEHPSWEKGDLGKWYAAPTGALNFNDNCIDVLLWPTSPGNLVGYEVFPPTDWVTIQNQCRTGAGKNPWIHRPAATPVYQLRGQCSKRAPLQAVAVPDPGIFTGEVFKQVLTSQGIKVLGGVKRRVAGDVNPEALQAAPEVTIDLFHTPIADALRRALSDSQNLFAECLLKSVARQAPLRALPQPPIGTWAGGSEVAVEILRSWAIDPTGIVIADGSGLSRQNRVSAEQLVRVLHHVYLDPPARELFMSSLAINGERGTMRKRLKELPPHVWAKTGYLNGIRSMSGFVKGDDDQWFAFAVLFNNISGGTAPYNKLHDDICRVLIAGK